MSLPFCAVVIRCNDKSHVFSDGVYEELNTGRGYLHRRHTCPFAAPVENCLRQSLSLRFVIHFLPVPRVLLRRVVVTDTTNPDRHMESTKLSQSAKPEWE